MEDLQGFLAEIPPSAEKIHEDAPGGQVYGDGHGVDGKIPPVEVMLQGIGEHLRLGDGKLVKLPPGCGHIDFLASREYHCSRLVPFVNRYAEAVLFPASQKSGSVSLHHDVQVQIVPPEKKIPNDAADDVGPHSQFFRPFPQGSQKADSFRGEAFLKKPRNILGPGKLRGAASLFPRNRQGIKGFHKVGAGYDADNTVSLGDGQPAYAVGDEKPVGFVHRGFFGNADDSLGHEFPDEGLAETVKVSLVQIFPRDEAEDGLSLHHGEGGMAVPYHDPVGVIHRGIRRYHHDGRGHDVACRQRRLNRVGETKLHFLCEEKRLGVVKGDRSRLGMAAASEG